MVAKRSVGTKLKVGLNYIGGLTSIGAPTKTAETLDTTTLDSDGGYRTFVTGFKDGGEVAISGYFEPGDQGQLDLDEVFEAGTPEPFEIIFPAEMGASWTFEGVVTNLAAGNAELDALLAFEATIKVSGRPTLNTSPSSGLTSLSLTGAGGDLSPAFANGTHYYTYEGVTASSVTLTSTAANHDLKLYVNGEFLQTLTSGQASQSIPLTTDVGKKLTIIAQEEGKTPVVYEVVAVKTA